MSQRGQGFKPLEDEILCTACVQVSFDSAVGTYQTKEDFWSKIETFYNHKAVDENGLEARTVKSLSCRFDKISSPCTLFRAVLTQVQSQNQSGGNSESMAKELYAIKDKQKQSFKFEHAWKILQFHPKWADHSQSSHQSSPLEGYTPVSQDTGNTSSTKKRGTDGIKKAKKKLNNEKDPMWEEMMSGAAKSNTLMEKHHKEMLAVEKEKLAVKKHKNQLEAQKQDFDVMNKDLSNLSSFSYKFFKDRKQAVIDRNTMPRVARNLDFDAGGSGASHEDVYVPESPNIQDGAFSHGSSYRCDFLGGGSPK